MTRFAATLRYAAFNVGFAIVLYFAAVEGSKGADNLLTFGVWVAFLASLSMLSNEIRLSTKVRRDASGGSVVPLWFDRAYDILFMAVMVWCGFMFLSSLWLMHVVFLSLEPDAAEPEAS